MGRPGFLATVTLALLLAGCAQHGPTQPSPATGQGTTMSSPTTSSRTTPATASPSPATTSLSTSPSTGPRPTPSPMTSKPSPTSSRSTAPKPTTHPLSVGKDAWVTVSVATLWRTPSSPRAIDAAALENPARIRAWLGGLSDDARRGLDGRADTQALLGDRVVVTRLTDSWAQVVVPSQPTPLDRRGYSGWVPRRQLTAVAPGVATREATVVTRTAWLRRDDAGRTAVLEVSLGTRLGVASGDGEWVRLLVPPGRVLVVSAREVSLTAPGAPALPPTGRDLVRTAQLFSGLPYLWAGTSGFGVDCSGLTSLVHRVHGIVIPRDAAPQSLGGTAVRATAASPGDLLFFARNGLVHHVSLYVGDGQMIHAPRTSVPVQTIPVTTPAYLAELAAVRRFVG